MNILYLTTHLNIGGISSYIFTLAKGLKEKGHNVYVASSGGELLQKFKENGITHVNIPIKTKSEANFIKISLSLFKLLKFIKENNIDVIHTNTRVTQVLGCLLKYYCGKTHITTCHGFFKPRFFRRILPCWGDKVIAISEAVKEHLINDFRIPEENIRVIHNGIDINKFREQKNTCLSAGRENREQRKQELGLGNGPIIGIIARLSDVKGHIYLIKAMKPVLEKFPSCQLLIVGEGKQQGELTALIETLGIKQSVILVPNTLDTKEALSVMDLFVMPSLKEGLGLSLMEAMASGLGVIGSDVGGIKSLIQHGVGGLLVKPKDSDGLSQAIIDLLSDKDKRESFGKNAQSFISQNFSQDKMVSQTEQLYNAM